MPVRRFRSVEEMEESVWMDRDDPRLWSTIASVWALSTRLCPAHYPPGVYKAPHDRGYECADRCLGGRQYSLARPGREYAS